jgi:methyl-accepting chemotaxis protein PixJ
MMYDLNSSNPIQKTQKFIRSNLIVAIVSSICLNLTLTATSTWNVWNTSRNLEVTVARQEKLQDLSSQLIYLDEVLSMSANMLINTGQPIWEKRYVENTPIYDRVEGELFKNIPTSLTDNRKQFDLVAKELFDAEDRAFKLVKEKKLTEAIAILQGEKYAGSKKSYAKNIRIIIDGIKTETSNQTKVERLSLDWSIYLALISVGLLAATGVGIVVAVRGYMKEQQSDRDALETSQDNLQMVNLQLANESGQRQQQEQLTSQENDQLQHDIGELLDVVCEIESGNLTIQAKVNDRATGLVGDTLNRLIEELGRTLTKVSVAAQRVESDSKTQKDMATIIAQNTSLQAEGVSEMSLLTRKVRQSAENTRQQSIVTRDRLMTLESSVTEGQKSITNLDLGIGTLQAGSDRIVQEMKTLGEFVGLADRFVQDQSEIVTETQILALNASLVAARAAEQRDPKQFAAVAREFELIASQISQLAQQTNEGLTTLEQRSNQIHKVVSSVDLDVQTLGGLVNTFTAGVKQTRDVFSTVQIVTEDVVKSGELVSTASERILQATDSTKIAIESVDALSQEIAQQSQDAQNLGDRLSTLSTDLLANIQIFKLPQVELAATVANEQLAVQVSS